MQQMKETLYEAANAAGAVIQSYFQGVFKIESKDRINDLVTEVDKHSETAIINIIKRDFPAHSIISEEVGELMQDSEYQWIIIRSRNGKFCPRHTDMLCEHRFEAKWQNDYGCRL